MDPYRILPSGLKVRYHLALYLSPPLANDHHLPQKPFLQFNLRNPSSSTTPTVQSLLSLSPIAYSSRLADKAVIIAKQTREQIAQINERGKGKGKGKETDEGKGMSGRAKEREAARTRKRVGVMSSKEAKRKGVWEVRGGDKIK